MSTTIESLEIEVLSNSKSASKGLDKLTKSLEKLKTATSGGIGLTSVNKDLEKLNSTLTSVSSRTNKVSSTLNTARNNVNKYGESYEKSTKSATNFLSKHTILITVVKTLASAIGDGVAKMNNYIESVNLFNASMGQYGSDAQAYAENVGEIMGIDPGDWMRNQGIFMTLATGFGVAGDRAAVMSQQLTQLGYDLSSFYNEDVESAMQRLQSGLSGELEPLRRLGYDLSQAKLEATALSLGIDKSVSSMTQAEKAQLRYYAIMTQVTVAQGDMARTLESPANQLRIFKAQIEQAARAIGSIFIPMVNAVLPYAIALAKAVRFVAEAIADFAGFAMPEVDYSGIDTVVGGAEDASNALDDASASAKKLKSYMMGFDELNVINPDSGGSSAEDISSQFDFELPTYDFIGEATNSRVSEIFENIKNGLLELKEIFSPVIDGIKKLFDTIKEQFDKFDWGAEIKNTLTEVANVLSTVIETVLDILTPLIDALNIPEILFTILETFTGILRTLGRVVDSLRPTLVDFVETALVPIAEFINDILIDAFKFLGDEVADLGKWLSESEAIKSLISSLGELLGNVFKAIKPVLEVLWNSNKKLLSSITDLLQRITELVSPVLSALFTILGKVFAWLDKVGVFEVFANILDGILDIIIGILTLDFSAISRGADTLYEVFSPVAEWIDVNVIQPVVGFFSNLWQNVVDFVQPVVDFFEGAALRIGQFFEGCWLVIQAVWITVSTWFNTYVIQPVVTFFKSVWTKVSGFFSSLWNGIKNVWNVAAKWFDDTIIKPVKTAFETACNAIKNAFAGVWLNIRRGVAGAMNGVIGAIESALNWVIGGINKLIEGFNKVVKWAADVVGADWGGVSLLGEVKFSRVEVPQYADGAYDIPSGQLFIAREAGAEMVGNIGNRTAVANNDQIVAGIANGVAEANGEQNALLKEQNELLRALLEKENGVYLDGRSLTNSVERYQRERGRVLLTGGAY